MTWWGPDPLHMFFFFSILRTPGSFLRFKWLCLPDFDMILCYCSPGMFLLNLCNRAYDYLAYIANVNLL